MVLDLVGLGSAIIDFVPGGKGPLSMVQSFTPSAGGAVANVVVAASRLGLKTGLIGCVGDDEFGSFIIRDLQCEGVDTSRVRRVKGRRTGIAFYSIDEKGERHYLFYRFPGYSDPESSLEVGDLEEAYIRDSRMLHFSESMLRLGGTREAVFKALRAAKEGKVQVSYDPNVREDLWGSRGELQEVQGEALTLTDIFLSTIREASLIAGCPRNPGEAVDRILALGPSTIVLRGRNRYQVVTRGRSFEIPVFRVKAADTSGAGDAFDAGFLAGLLKGLPLEEAVILGNAVAALKVMKVGTRSGLPGMGEALEFIRKRTGVELQLH
ncbi:MAG: carbohydrate kinase family protein [Candidatus Bathyarchaeia archaeon]